MPVHLPISNVQDVAAYGLCHGCGACAYACSNQAVELRNFIDDGVRPIVDSSRCGDCTACLGVCSGLHLEQEPAEWPAEVDQSLGESWGPVLEVWEGHAADEEMRFKAGSGGAATALVLYCLERMGAGGVLHVGMDEEKPYLNRAGVSRNREDLVSRVGSRYAPAAVCAHLGVIESSEEPMVLVGKPCDIASAQRARQQRPELDRKLMARISIFCAGTPSTRGTLELLAALGVNREQISDLRYRGHGWPGMSGAGLRSGGERVEMPYRQAWDEVLTKHIPFRCKICPDGTGQFADIACGDPWYRPVGEHEKGSNLILVRTRYGCEIMRGAMEAGYITAESRGADVVAQSQRGLLMRRRTIWPKAAWAAVLGWPFPTYRGFGLLRNWLRLPIWDRAVSLRRGVSYIRNLRRAGPARPTAKSIAEAGVVRSGVRGR